MHPGFHQDVECSFAEQIAKRGFRVLAGGHDPEDFGNALVILESEQYSIRLVRDRGQVFVDLASPADPGNWHGLGRVLAVLHGKREDEEQWSRPISLGDAAGVIEEHHEALAQTLSADEFEHTCLELERLGKLAKEKLLGGSD